MLHLLQFYQLKYAWALGKVFLNYLVRYLLPRRQEAPLLLMMISDRKGKATKLHFFISTFSKCLNKWRRLVVSSPLSLSLSLSLCVCVFLILFEGSFRNWQKFEPNLGNIFAIGQIFNVVNGQILKQIIKPSGHTDGEYCYLFLLLLADCKM